MRTATRAGYCLLTTLSSFLATCFAFDLRWATVERMDSSGRVAQCSIGAAAYS